MSEESQIIKDKKHNRHFDIAPLLNFTVSDEKDSGPKAVKQLVYKTIRLINTCTLPQEFGLEDFKDHFWDLYNLIDTLEKMENY